MSAPSGEPGRTHFTGGLGGGDKFARDFFGGPCPYPSPHAPTARKCSPRRAALSRKGRGDRCRRRDPQRPNTRIRTPLPPCGGDCFARSRAAKRARVDGEAEGGTGTSRHGPRIRPGVTEVGAEKEEGPAGSPPGQLQEAKSRSVKYRLWEVATKPDLARPDPRQSQSPLAPVATLRGRDFTLDREVGNRLERKVADHLVHVVAHRGAVPVTARNRGGHLRSKVVVEPAEDRVVVDARRRH